MNNNNSSDSINEKFLVPISELPFQYNNSIISSIETLEKKEKEKKKEIMVKTRKQRKEEKSENSNQHSLEKWFSPNSKPKLSKNKYLNNEPENVTLIDLTENSDTESKDSEATVVVAQDEVNSIGIKSEKVSEKNTITSKKNDINNNITIENKNEIRIGNEFEIEIENKVIKSPYFSRSSKNFENSKIILNDNKKVKNNLISHNETDENMDIDKINIKDNINENDIVTIANNINDIDSKKIQINNNSNDFNFKKTDKSNGEEKEDKEKEKENRVNSDDDKIEIINNYDDNIFSTRMNLRNDKENVDSVSNDSFEENLNNESENCTIINGRSLRKRPSKDNKTNNIKKNENNKQSIKNSKKEIINNNEKEEEEVNDSNSNNEDDDENNNNEIKSDINNENNTNKNSKKRRRESTGNEVNMKKVKLKSEELEENEEIEKKVTYKQAALTGFSKIPSTRARAFKTKTAPRAAEAKKVIPIPEFHELSNSSISNRYKNLVIPDILKLLSVSDFLEKFGKYILEWEEEINFYSIYQAIVYPSQNSFKFLSSIYIILLQYLNKNNTANLIIPINENTWQYYLIPTITNTLRIQYGLKRNTMDNYVIPDHLQEFISKEFYFITPLAHVKTLKQLISIIADTPQYREQIEGMLDRMVQLSNEKRIEMMQKKIMEEEANDIHRDVNIVGIRIKTLEIEQKKQKEENKKNGTKIKIDHRALSRLHAEYNKKVSSLDKMKRTIKKKNDSIQAKKKEKIDIKNKILKGNERFLGIDRNNKFYWVLDIKYQSPNKDIEDGSDSEDDSKKEKNESKKSKSILSFITTDKKGKLALPSKNDSDESIYGIIIENSSKKRNIENKDDYYNVYNYYDEDIIYNGTYEYMADISEIKKLLNSLQLDDYDEEQLHANIIDFFSSRGYTFDSQTKLGNSATDINVETSLQKFKEWCDNLGITLDNVTEDNIKILNEKNVVMYINRINEIAFALEKDYELPPITIILDDMVSNEMEKDNVTNNILRYRYHCIKEITKQIKEIYTNHSDSIPHENIRKNIKHQSKNLESTILNNNDVKLIIKKDKKAYVKFSEYQLDKIDDVNQLSDLYSWFFEIKKILDVKCEKIIGKKPNPKSPSYTARGTHNLRERKKTNYVELYYSDDDDFMD